MARDAVHKTDGVVNSQVAFPAGGTITQANGSVFTPASGATLEEYLFKFSHTASSTKTATVKGGANPPANASLDLTVTCTGDGSTTPVVVIVGPISSARFVQADGTVNIDYASGFTGTIEAIRIPRTA